MQKKNPRKVTYKPTDMKVLLKINPKNRRTTPINFMLILNIEEMLKEIITYSSRATYEVIAVSTSNHALKGLMRAIRYWEEKEKEKESHG